MKRTVISFLLTALVLSVAAESDTTVAPIDSTKKATPIKSYFSATISYLSNSIYNGRKDSVATPYITPTIGYYDKSGFFADASLSYLARAGSGRVDLFNVEAGYDFYIGDFDGEVSASKSFYNSNSTNVKSEITGSVFFNGGYDFNFIKPSVEAGINFGNKSDYVFNFGLEHSFYAANDKFLITPTVKANGSTQNYYGSYYNRKKIGGKKKNAGVVYDVSAAVEDAAKYKVLDYEFSLPISYTLKKFTFLVLPTYVVPVNPALINVTLKPETGTGATINRTQTEVISNSFYCSVGVSYKF